ncbi:hypothetical protein R0137_03720 [Congregibacter brevis]|uniref:DUF4760 domain-containing protein n=1 Tax=Congregibacter brevis TaxID=3081201 RepID=A0ABZ0IG68_9GAMM|nr:hypothetical protein R0137_03720 [Congregibacter sp. IMCC45268]
MNWEAIAATSEVVGAIAVVVSLVYLATQVAVSNRLARAEAWRVPNSDLNSLNAAFATDPVFRSAQFKLYHQGVDRSGLSNDECVAIDMYIVSVLNIYEQIYREVREGTLKEYSIRDFGASSILDLLYFQESWSLYKPSLGASFVEYFESNVISKSERGDT